MQQDDPIIFALKKTFKKYPLFFNVIYYTFGAWSFGGKSASSFAKKYSSSQTVLNIGSGVKKIGAHVKNVDVNQYPGVDVCASVYNLPFETNSVDALIAESFFEHIEKPNDAIIEMTRVLAQGGTLFITVPFIAYYHSSPGDFWRFTQEGITSFLRSHGYEIESVGVQSGPSSALAGILSSWFACLFSFGLRPVYEILFIAGLILTTPIKLFDVFLVHYKTAKQAAFSFYCIASKK